jgi:hypothetical protein
MSTPTAATAVAPTAISNRDVAINLVQQSFGFAHMIATGVADMIMYSEAHIVNKIDKTITVQQSIDYRSATTNAKLEKFRNKMSGYKAENVVK